jgi:glycosyltransferase involved in cell wall biosynthesis
MSLDNPYVSVCLPVYNGEAFVREAIRSVLEQTFEDLELIISDNASTDGTGAICRDLPVHEPRARYVRADVNHGLAWNHNRAFRLARGRYVMWMGHDDIIEKGYIRGCVETLDRDPELVLCFSNENHIDADGNLIRKVAIVNDAKSRRPSERFKRIVRLEHWCNPIFGLMRRDVLQQTQLHGAFADSDRVLLAELALRGRFGHIPQHLFLRRVHSMGTTKRAYFPRERSVIFDPANAHKMVFPFVQKATGFIRAVHSAPLPRGERCLCDKHMLRWLWTYRRHLREDIREELAAVMKRNLSENQVNLLKSMRRLVFGMAQNRQRAFT